MELIKEMFAPKKILSDLLVSLVITFIIVIIIGVITGEKVISILFDIQILLGILFLYITIIPLVFEIRAVLIPEYKDFKERVVLPTKRFREVIELMSKKKIDINSTDYYVLKKLYSSIAVLYMNNYLSKEKNIEIFVSNLRGLNISTLYLMREKIQNGFDVRRLFIKIDEVMIPLTFGGMLSQINTFVGPSIEFFLVFITLLSIGLFSPFWFTEFSSKHEYTMLLYYLDQVINSKKTNYGR
ncbi:hypothetical protein [Companilactobacillus insicii]|uniref:hypothetical protein n=1 Tax=Companilactobacillus insicii TaxID=1732567 RepID=UPI000F7AD175|nr:hypothetical protein [Companilactobacillus insicii]